MFKITSYVTSTKVGQQVFDLIHDDPVAILPKADLYVHFNILSDTYLKEEKGVELLENI